MLKIRFIKIISEIVYRARILFIGAVTKKPIDRLINKIYDAEDYSFWDSILAYAYRRELNAYVLAADVNVLKQSDDVFINNPIIMQYEREFIELANKYTFKMKGMINSSLLILYCMIRHTKPEIFIESGLGNGYSSGYIAEALRMNNNGAKMYCLSFFSPEEYENVTNTLKPFDFVQIIEGRSEITIDSLSEQCKDNTIGVLDGESYGLECTYR
ncbi:MAG: hypothetical protein HQK93_01725 [Nitrospirae bacterium]|nr:hypothetical protein [Nitrospirota bacterium]